MPRVLVVENSRTEALRARLILEHQGFQVSLASDGKEGVSRAVEENPDLILLSTVMPHTSGYEVYGRLQLDPRTRDIPVVMLVGDPLQGVGDPLQGVGDPLQGVGDPLQGTVEGQVDLPENRGLADFLLKPYAPHLLVDKVRQVTEARAPGESNAGTRLVSTEEINRNKDQVQRARQEAEKANRAKSDFLANMSHELCTPLHEFMGMIDLVLATELTSEQRNYLKTAKSSSNTLLTLVSDILEFSEIEAGQFILQEKDVDPWTPVESTVEMMAPRATEKGIKFSAYLSPHVPRALVGDSTRLRQVLIILVGNAIKFTEQGAVSIRLEVEAIRENGVELHFLVSDTGMGIPEDKRRVIFEPFHQADNSATRRYGGLGLGLAMAQQLVDLMGGRIWVESDGVPGRGSTFHCTVTLKRPARAAQSLPHAARPTVESTAQLQILLAEDSPTNQLIAVSNLKKAGHTVTVANNGLMTVQLFEEKGRRGSRSFFDLVLMDVAMPEMDGLEATKAIREKEKALGGHVPIIAMTAFTTKEYHEKCLAAGMDAYVIKPVRIDELYKAIEPFLSSGLEPSGGVEFSEPPASGGPGKETAAFSPVVLAEALEIVGGDVDLMRDAVAMSLEEVPGELAALKEAMAQQDAHGVEAKAHRLKGVMGNVGGMIARQVAQRLETMGEQGNLAGGLDWVEALEKEIKHVTAFYSDPEWEQLARREACEESGDG